MEFTGLKQQYDLLRSDINAGIQRVLDHGQYIMGPEVAQLEAALAQYCGARHCVTVSLGTEALLISLMAPARPVKKRRNRSTSTPRSASRWRTTAI